jgi:hypothetical protein
MYGLLVLSCGVRQAAGTAGAVIASRAKQAHFEFQIFV